MATKRRADFTSASADVLLDFVGLDVSATRDPRGGVHLSLKCGACGKELSKTSQDFGMDCESSCAEKAFRANGGDVEVSRLKSLFEIIGEEIENEAEDS